MKLESDPSPTQRNKQQSMQAKAMPSLLRTRVVHNDKQSKSTQHKNISSPMAAALLLPNLALLSDAALPASKPRHSPDLALALALAVPRQPRRDPSPLPITKLAFQDSPSDAASDPVPPIGRLRRRRCGSAHKVGASAAEGGGGEEEDDENGIDWEAELRSRLKDLEEMKELEKKAAEIVAESPQGDEDETEEEKKERVRRELEKVAREQAERRKTARLMFELGQKAYGKGMYARAIEFLEAALTIVPRPTLFGGEVVDGERMIP